MGFADTSKERVESSALGIVPQKYRGRTCQYCLFSFPSGLIAIEAVCVCVCVCVCVSLRLWPHPGSSQAGLERALQCGKPFYVGLTPTE